MGRHPCSVKQKLRKGLWSPEEDEKLYNYIIKFGVGCWSSVPKHAGLQRCGKSCRLRWINYLRPDLKRGMFSPEEEDIILRLHEVLGNRWAQIAAKLPGRTDNEIKNFWNSCLKKKLIKRGIDPNTHKPLTQTTMTTSSSSISDGPQNNNHYNNNKSSTTTIPQPKTTLPFNLSPFSQIELALRPEPQHHQIFDPLFSYESVNTLPGQLGVENESPHSLFQFGTLPNLANLEYGQLAEADVSATSASRVSSLVINNNDNNNNNNNVMVNETQFPNWETCENYKTDYYFSMSSSQFPFPFSIKSEEAHHHNSSDDFCEYSLPTLPQDLSGENLEFFMSSTKFNV